jgi:hypothetical protein
MRIARPHSPAARALPDLSPRLQFRPPRQAAPHAEFRPVAAAKQAQVAARVAQAVGAAVRVDLLPAAKKAQVQALLAHVGQPDFYDVMAKLDPESAPQWTAMAGVQRQFAAAEPGYDLKTRAYSESMRLTLHAAVIQHFADPSLRGGQSLYERFLELHPTAFHQNGGWFDNLQLPLDGALKVIQATPLEMAEHGLSLLRGAAVDDKPTERAAELVRQARASVLTSAR